MGVKPWTCPLDTCLHRSPVCCCHCSCGASWVGHGEGTKNVGGKAWGDLGNSPRPRAWNLPANGLALDAPMAVVLGALSGLAWGKGNRMQPGVFQLQSEPHGVGCLQRDKGPLRPPDPVKGRRAQATPAILGSQTQSHSALTSPRRLQVPGEGEPSQESDPSRLKHSNMLVLMLHTLHVPGLPYADICTTTHSSLHRHRAVTHTPACIHTAHLHAMQNLPLIHTAHIGCAPTYTRVVGPLQTLPWP